MKILNTVIATSILALGLAGTTMAAQNNPAAKQQQASQSSAKKQVQKTYTVRKGDTLQSIAKKYKVTVQKLTELNKTKLSGKKANNLQVGTVLRIS